MFCVDRRRRSIWSLVSLSQSATLIQTKQLKTALLLENILTDFKIKNKSFLQLFLHFGAKCVYP